jgi:hypothetical protein
MGKKVFDSLLPYGYLFPMILRKLGPQAAAPLCSGGYTCPDIFELTSGDFAVIGTDITEQATGWLPPGSGCGPHERIVTLPRRTLVQARPDIPTAL